MTHEVVMPQLGMTQETGVVVRWLKQPGEAVKASDVLMEVESDKAVLEIQAGSDGSLLETLCDEGVEVPVGSVVALIGDSGKSAVNATNKKTEVPAAPSASKEEDVLEIKAETKAQPVSQDGKILASPKAKESARRQGIDLRDLRDMGLQQPYHHADIVKFTVNRTGANPAAPASPAKLAIEIEAKAFKDFVSWASAKTEGTATAKTVLCAFAAGSWRANFGSDPVIEYGVPGEPSPSRLQGCSLARLGEPEQLAADGQRPELVLLNLMDAGLVDYEPGNDPMAPLLAVSINSRAILVVSLRYDEQLMQIAGAINFLRTFGNRLAYPLNHLL